MTATPDRLETAIQQSANTGQESLPFTVRVVRGEAALGKALQVRQSAYGRHVPEMAGNLDKPEELDFDPGAVILLAESKLDGAAIGTMRIQSNHYSPLWLEQSVGLPNWLQGQHLAEATRLGILTGQLDRVVKAALFKVYYWHCMHKGIDWMVIAGRPPIDRQYEALLFQDVFPQGPKIPMKHAGNLAHRVMAFNIPGADKKWRDAGHPLYKFIVLTRHPDITGYTAATVPHN